MDSTLLGARAATTGFTVAAVVAAGLSIGNGWWAGPAALAAFLAGQRPGRTAPIASALVAVLAAGVVALVVVPAWLTLAGRFVVVVSLALTLPWFTGRFWRQCRELVRAGWERAAQLEREQQLIAEHARLRERTRIAQDIHDVLGHDLSLIALSAGALKLAPGLEPSHRQAAGDIRARAAAAVERLGEVIGVLRDDADQPPTAPGDAGLPELIAEASAAGLPVELHVGGDPGALPAAAERAVHRVVQEALTNVAKHAAGAAATVRVLHTAAGTHVVVENGPPPPAADRRPLARTGGHGLIGLRERVRLAGGSLEHGPHGGGYAVAARIPRQPSRPAPATAPGGTLPPEHRRARRRVGRALVAAVLVPLVSGAVLSGALMVAETLSASRSVLDRDDYARLSVGQSRSEVERFLPDRQTNHRPRVAEPTGDGMTCEYYAMTADRFDDRSGDAYRLCFRGNTLESVDDLTPAGSR
ncbi:sensor histidine kinase [Cryptosporangium arvum]|uniref:histidine kinase n=1 Tax=Cryptosporangium arvum DSM 44712 TaxID=927661 RepID=A0A010ZZH2_9ACTN|nr:histidine kinase [Cryptosporangium arvum]EXG82622.1 signal transduction histidine kinase [Cryptosporangium arvum DSM 44712]